MSTGRITGVVLIIVSLVFGWRCSAAEEARAAIEPRTPDAKPQADPLLGALSFGSSKEPISITAATLDFDYRTKVITYRGNVVATQGDMQLQSNTLTVALDNARGDRLKEVVAEGAVKLSKGSRWATAKRAVFDQVARTVVLSEEAVLHDGQNEVSGERVVVYLDEQRSVVEGGEQKRVKAVLYPPENAAEMIAGEERQ